MNKINAGSYQLFALQVCIGTNDLELRGSLEHTSVFYNLHLVNDSRNEKAEMEALLKEYDDVFQTLSTLPPPRNFDHKIPLKEGTSPINVRPYRYPNIQKNIIEQLVKELLEGGVTQPSTSPYSSPVVLVKEDGTWRMLIDYRELNKHTVKNKYPIPVIEELLDELYSSSVFSKINLRSGGHQIRMDPLDVSRLHFELMKAL